MEIELAVPQLAKPDKQAGVKESGAFLAEPVLAIGEQSVRSPRERRKASGSSAATSPPGGCRADGAEVAAGKWRTHSPAFAWSQPGHAASQSTPAADFRVIVKTVKVDR